MKERALKRKNRPARTLDLEADPLDHVTYLVYPTEENAQVSVYVCVKWVCVSVCMCVCVCALDHVFVCMHACVVGEGKCGWHDICHETQHTNSSITNL